MYVQHFLGVYPADSSLHSVLFGMTGMSVKREKGGGSGGAAANTSSPLTMPHKQSFRTRFFG